MKVIVREYNNKTSILEGEFYNFTTNGENELILTLTEVEKK